MPTKGFSDPKDDDNSDLPGDDNFNPTILERISIQKEPIQATTGLSNLSIEFQVERKVLANFKSEISPKESVKVEITDTMNSEGDLCEGNKQCNDSEGKIKSLACEGEVRTTAPTPQITPQTSAREGKVPSYSFVDKQKCQSSSDTFVDGM